MVVAVVVRRQTTVVVVVVDQDISAEPVLRLQAPRVAYLRLRPYLRTRIIWLVGADLAPEARQVQMAPTVWSLSTTGLL